MYNNNDTIMQGRNKVQKQSKDKKLNFKSIAASSFVGAMAGAGAMWAGEALASEQNNDVTAEGTTAETQTIAQPTEQEVTADTLANESKAQPQHETAATPKADTTAHTPGSHTTHHDEPQLTPASHTQGYAAQHDIQIESVETMTTDDGRTINMAIGTVDGHMAAFQMDDDNRVVASFVDRNDNGEVDDNEVTDLRSEHMTLNTLTSGNNDVQMTAESNDNTDSPDEIHVIAVQNDVDINGHSVDVAHVSVDGEHVALVDVTQNGEVDVLIADSNHNGQIDDNELHDISDSHMPMPSADDVEGDYGHIAQSDTDLPDYSNDADITLYDA